MPGKIRTRSAKMNSISWEELGPLFRRHDLAGVELHLRWLVDHGVTCIRLMLECAQAATAILNSRSAGSFPPWCGYGTIVFALCSRVGLRILLTPVRHVLDVDAVEQHPFNALNGGPLASRAHASLRPRYARRRQSAPAFAAERWGGSGALFAWDLWNEIHPAHAEEDAACLAPLSTISAPTSACTGAAALRPRPSSNSIAVRPRTRPAPHLNLEGRSSATPTSISRQSISTSRDDRLSPRHGRSRGRHGAHCTRLH